MERWLSADRFATYVSAAAGDHACALRLYEWNVRVSGALFHDLAHLEVALRNAYDRALSSGATRPWTDPTAAPFAAPATGINDPYARFRQQIGDARDNAVKSIRGPVRHGDVVAQLGFGFWRFLSAKAHEKTLWVPHLHRAFPPGTDRRRDVDDPVTRLHRTRNRIAHHEPLLRVNLRARVQDVVALATLLDRDLGAYVTANSDVTRLVAARP